MIRKISHARISLLVCGTLVLVMTAVSLSGCAGRSLLSDRHDPEYYRIPRLLPAEALVDENPSFLVYGDTQCGWRFKEKFVRQENWKTPWMLAIPFYQVYWLSNGIWGLVNWKRQQPDFGEDNRRLMRDVIYQAATEKKSRFLLNLGDICASDGSRAAHWEKFLDEHRDHQLLKEVPYLPVSGNHDNTNDPLGKANFAAVFDYPLFYSVEMADAVLIVVDSNIILDQMQGLSQQQQEAQYKQYFLDSGNSWLERELAKYRHKKFKIIAMHHTLLSFASHFKDWDRKAWGYQLQQKRRDLLDLFAREGIDLLLSGHEHLYQHTVYQPANSDKLIHAVVSSSGGVPIRSVPSDKTLKAYADRFAQEKIDIKLIKIKPVNHYTEIEVSAGQLVVSTFEVDPSGDMARETLLEEIRLDAR